MTPLRSIVAFGFLGCIASSSSAAIEAPWPELASAFGDHLPGAAKTVQTLFGPKIESAARSPSVDDDVAAAVELLAAAKQTQDVPAVTALLCQHAYTLGARVRAGFPTAIEAMQLIAQADPQHLEAWGERTADVLQKWFRASTGDERKDVGEKLIDALLHLAEGKSQSGAYAPAQRDFAQAQAVARQIRSARVDAIKAAAQGVADAAKVSAEILKHEAQLEANPTGPGAVAAHRALFWTYLIERDDAARASGHAEHAGDDDSAAAVALAVKPGDTLTEGEVLRLGDWYRKLADRATAKGKVNMLARSAGYYERFVKAHPQRDAEHVRATLAMELIRKTLGALAPEPAATAEGGPTATKLTDPVKAAGQPGDTKAVGGFGGSAFRDVSSDSYLVGMRFWPTQNNVGAVQPLYSAKKGQQTGQRSGTGGRKGSMVELLAKPGYAVGAVQVALDDNAVGGVRLIFVQVRPDGQLDPKQRYLSDWAGSNQDLKAPVVGDGVHLVIGVHGRAALGVDALGLVLAPDR